MKPDPRLRSGNGTTARICVVSMLLSFGLVLCVSAAPLATASGACLLAQAEQDLQVPEDACADMNSQSEKVDCFCVQAVTKGASQEVGTIVAGIQPEVRGPWRQEMYLSDVVAPCLKSCAEAFEETIARTAKELAQYEASDQLALKLKDTVPPSLCADATWYNSRVVYYECLSQMGYLTDGQYGFLMRYGNADPLDNMMRIATEQAHVRSRAARRTCMLACCGRVALPDPPPPLRGAPLPWDREEVKKYRDPAAAPRKE